MKQSSTSEMAQQITEILESRDRDLRSWLRRDIIAQALGISANNLDTLDLKIIRRFLAEYRDAAQIFKPYRKIRKTSIFGSARTPEDDPYYQAAAQFARLLVEEGFMVITGAGNGIMRAGNEGASAAQSFGASILLPLEGSPNAIIAEDPKLITFRYFFIRKLFFVMEAHAVALFPGGFGTHDECFEVLTLLQTGKSPPAPLVLVELPGEDYWESWDWFIRKQLLSKKFISPEDTAFYHIVHTPAEGVKWIKHFYSAYHSMRRVGDQLVIRLEKELRDEQMRQLNEEFGDVSGREGGIMRSVALAAEADEPDLEAKPRIVFKDKGTRPGRLLQLIMAINDLGQS